MISLSWETVRQNGADIDTLRAQVAALEARPVYKNNGNGPNGNSPQVSEIINQRVSDLRGQVEQRLDALDQAVSSLRNTSEQRDDSAIQYAVAAIQTDLWEMREAQDTVLCSARDAILSTLSDAFRAVSSAFSPIKVETIEIEPDHVEPTAPPARIEPQVVVPVPAMRKRTLHPAIPFDPTTLRAEYEAGATSKSLATKYHTQWDVLRLAIVSDGGTIRPRGLRVRKPKRIVEEVEEDNTRKIEPAEVRAYYELRNHTLKQTADKFLISVPEARLTILRANGSIRHKGRRPKSSRSWREPLEDIQASHRGRRTG